MGDFRNDLVALLPRLRRFALTLTASGQDADDLVQAAVERALRHQNTWQPGSRLDSWMYKIIQNLWIDETRARRRRLDPLEAAADLIGEDGRDVTAMRTDLLAVRRAMATLPEDQRVVLTLVVLDGMSYQVAAETLGVPIGTIMSRLARARAALTARLGETQPTKAERQWSN